MDTTATPTAGEAPAYDPPSEPRWLDGPGGPSGHFSTLAAPPVGLVDPADGISGPVPRSRLERLSRVVNISIATLALIVLSPALLVIAVAIAVTSSGPIVYRQTRTGLDRRWRTARLVDDRRQEDFGGRVFTILKFRTMEEDAERESGAVWASESDPRVTRVGRFMRRLRIDELPQFWNVLRGDMNVVGPRPERPTIVVRLREEIPEYQWRHRVKPGITGLAQVNQSYDASISDVRGKLRWDMEYIRRQSLALDLRIMIATVPAVLMRVRGW